MSEIKVGDRVEWRGDRQRVGVVMAADNGWAWVQWPGAESPLTERVFMLTLIPPKIAEPGMGEVVWDFYEPAGKRIAWRRGRASMWAAYVNDGWAYRYWSDFSNDVTLAVDPKAGA